MSYLLAGAATDVRATATRNGDARYAVKYLMLADATQAERVQARVDLAIEVNFLHVLSHPHIIKMRGLFKSETPFHPDYFFVMDRLFGTLEDKTKEWIAAKREYKVAPTQCGHCIVLASTAAQMKVLTIF
jgi:hypothetical protein